MRFVAALVLVIIPAFAHAESPAAAGASRSKVVAGGSVVVWDRRGRLQPTYRLVAHDGTSTALTRRTPGKDATWWDASFHGEVQIAAGTKPGAYKVVSGPVEYAVTVVAAGGRRTRRAFPPGTPVATIQAAVSTGSDILLNPGLHEWSAPLKLAHGSSLVGPGAVIRWTGPRQPDGKEWQSHAVIGAELATVDGVTFDLGTGVEVAQRDTAPNLTFRHCHFLGPATLSRTGPGIVVEDCEFVGGGVWASEGLYRRCLFRDTQRGHAFNCWVAGHNLALVDCTFLRTDRGPVTQARWGDIRGDLFLGTQVYDVGWSEGGCESFLCEPKVGETKYGFHDNLILHTRLRAGAGGGSAVQWDGHATGNLVKELKQSGGLGFLLWGADVTDNTFEDFELRDGPGVVLGSGAARNTFRRGAVIGYRGGSWGLHDIRREWVENRAAVCWPANPFSEARPGPGNVFESVLFELPTGIAPAAGPGVVFATCRLNGQPLTAGGKAVEAAHGAAQSPAR